MLLHNKSAFYQLLRELCFIRDEVTSKINAMQAMVTKSVDTLAKMVKELKEVTSSCWTHTQHKQTNRGP
jgi:hypothetical protein